VIPWHEAFTGEIEEKRKTPPENRRGTLGKIGGLPVRKTGDEESHHQENHFEESHALARAVLSALPPGSALAQGSRSNCGILIENLLKVFKDDLLLR
jgi:hypothetical protein